MLDTLGNLGDFVGGIAVVVTLAYLVIQVRQNTAAIEASSRQQIVESDRQANRLWLEPGAARAWVRGLHRDPGMDFEALDRVTTMFNDRALFFPGAYALHEHETGKLEDETCQRYLAWFSAKFATPGGRAWWEEIGRPIFAPRMVRAVDARVRVGGLPDVLALHHLQLDREEEAFPRPSTR